MNSILRKRIIETQIYLGIGIFALGLVLFTLLVARLPEE